MSRALLAEALGTLILVTCVVGTGIMGTRLAGDNLALALLANAGATGLILYLLITLFAPLSGAHFNPAVTLYAALRGQIGADRALSYGLAQTGGALCGMILAHAMFGLDILQTATTRRAGTGLWLGEAIATFGLCLTIAGARAAASAAPTPASAADRTPSLVAAWIAAAYWFTSSTSFANPAVTLARAFSDTFTGIHPADAPAFIAVQCLAALIAALTLPRLFPG